MDFTEVEAIEGLQWAWNAWPTTKPEASSLAVPLSIMATPLMPSPDLPVLLYEPLTCGTCGAAISPYAHVDYPSCVWHCPFCLRGRNLFPVSYSGIAEANLPAELFPTYCSVEYSPGGDVVGPAFVFVVDACVDVGEEMGAVKRELLLVLEQLPDNARVGLVMFDSMVRVYDLGDVAPRHQVLVTWLAT